MREEKIILTPQEFEYLENNYKCGYISGIPTLDWEAHKVWMKIFDKVDYWEEKLKAHDEIMQGEDSDRMIWFYKKYMQQESKKKQ